MAILDYPYSDLFHGAEFEFGLVSNTWAFRSPISQAVQTVGMPGARWRARISWDSNGLGRGESAQVEAFLMQLQGMANRVRLWDLSKDAPLGTASGAPIVFGAGQVGSQVVTQGWTANQANALRPGDMINVGTELKMVVAPVASDTQGRATIRFEPELRAAPANGSAIVTSRPTATFMSNSNDVGWTSVPGMLTRGHTLDLIEVIR